MINRIHISQPLALAAGFLSLLASSFAQSGGAENKVLNRDPGTDQVKYVDLPARILTLGNTPSRFVFSPAVTVAAGYASNPDQAPIHSGSYFLGATVNLDTERVDSSTNSVLSAGYGATGVFFEHDHDSNNEIDQTAYVAYQRNLTTGLQGRLSADFTHVTLDYDSLVSITGGTVDLRQAFSNAYAGGFDYTYQNRDSRYPITNSRRDTDAVRHIPSAYFVTDLSKLTGQANLPVVTVAYSCYWNLADGNDEDFSANHVSLRATNWVLGSGFSVDLDASYEDRDGENLNSRLGYLSVRHDQITRGLLILRHDMLSVANTQLALQGGYERARSNIVSGTYEGWTVALTGTRRF